MPRLPGTFEQVVALTWEECTKGMRSFVQSAQMGEFLGNSLQGKQDTVPLPPTFLYVNAVMQYAKINFR